MCLSYCLRHLRLWFLYFANGAQRMVPKEWCPNQFITWKHYDWLTLYVCRFGVYRGMLWIKVSFYSMNPLLNDPIVIY